MEPAYCGHCGLPASTRDHEKCERASTLDPPRFCAQCGRRMIVKITPDRWTAHCSRHGSRHSWAAEALEALDRSEAGDLSR